MSKSLGNYFTVGDLVGKGYSGREIRYLLLTAHYRETFNFTLENLGGARSALARLDECLSRLREIAGAIPCDPDPDLLALFTEVMDDDLNVSRAWGVVFEWVREQNRLMAVGGCTAARAGAALAAWERIDTVFGIAARTEAAPPPEILALLDERQRARKERDFARADALRGELKVRGWLIEDTPKGPRLKPGR